MSTDGQSCNKFVTCKVNPLLQSCRRAYLQAQHFHLQDTVYCYSLQILACRVCHHEGAHRAPNVLVLIKGLLYSLGSGEAPLLDIVAYAGYGFAGTSLAMLARIFWSYLYYFIMPWFCICTGVFLVKTMKRVLLGGPRSYERHPSRNHYFLLFLAVVQFPMLFWLGRISG